MSKLKWLYPGMKVKRYLFLMGLGVMFFSWGFVLVLVNFKTLDALQLIPVKFVYLATGKFFSRQPTGIALIVLGAAFVFFGFRFLNASLWGALAPNPDEDLVNVLFSQRQRQKGFKVVAIGGGTGLSTLLRGLKKYTRNITAAVTVCDDGGSSGKIREELGQLPPGDLRNCLVALADTEPLMKNLIQHRFTNGSLKDQNFGNLLIAALTEVTGDFSEAVRKTSSVLAVKGEVLPSTLERVTLCAQLDDGTLLEGETIIAKSPRPIEKVFLNPSFSSASSVVLDAIASADVIVLGPGSLYTSILPNLLLDGMKEAIKKSQAMKIYVCNVMTQPGETTGYAVSDHLKALFSHTDEDLVDMVIANDHRIHEPLVEKYAKTGAEPVRLDIENIKKYSVRVVHGDFVDESDVVRHHVEKLAKAIVSLWVERMK